MVEHSFSSPKEKHPLEKEVDEETLGGERRKNRTYREGRKNKALEGVRGIQEIANPKLRVNIRNEKSR